MDPESQAQLPQQHPKLRFQTPNLQNLFPSGVMSHQTTFLPNNICMESTTTEGAPVAEGLPEVTNAIGTQEKNDRDRNTLTTGNSLRVISSRRSIPGKIWMPTNQIGSTLARARVYPPIACACTSGISGYIKGRSRVAY